MLLFAHAGITLAAAKLFNSIRSWVRKQKTHFSLDYRLVLLGAMLPDIIDKPLGGIIFKDTLGSGRAFAHTLAFLLILVVAGVIMQWKWEKSWLLVLAGGDFMHLILDKMWLFPKTLFWPLYGWSFPKSNPELWIDQWLSVLSSDPSVYIPEIIGALILLIFAGQLFYKRKRRF
jgi:inner membrane protein